MMTQYIVCTSLLLSIAATATASTSSSFATAAFIPSVQKQQSYCKDDKHIRIINYNAFVGTSSSSRLDATATAAAAQQVKVDRVNICMGELCKCQEEGNNAESIMADLQSRDLPFDVEDAPCLGACGLGAMVSIEYENGDYNLVCGLEETLEAIGIGDEVEGDDEMNSNENVELKVDEQIVVKQNDSDLKITNSEIICEGDNKSLPREPKMNDDSQRGLNQFSLTETSSPIEAKTNNGEKKTEKISLIEETDPNENEIDNTHDAVNRMRAERSTEGSEEKTINPWLNMAMYVGKKVTDNIFK